MKGAPLTLAAVLALSVTLTAGTPVPRTVDVSEGTCRTLCEATAGAGARATCPPAGTAATSCCGAASTDAGTASPGSASPDSASPADAGCETCLLCQCGLAIPAPPAPVLLASPGEPHDPGIESSLTSVAEEPASPPPRPA